MPRKKNFKRCVQIGCPQKAGMVYKGYVGIPQRVGLGDLDYKELRGFTIYRYMEVSLN